MNDIATSLILSDPTDALGRKVVRCELNADRDLVIFDLPKRYAGHEHGETRFTEPVSVRYLDKEAVVWLQAWLSDVAELMGD